MANRNASFFTFLKKLSNNLAISRLCDTLVSFLLPSVKEGLKSFKENHFLSTIFVNSHYSFVPNRKEGNRGREDGEVIMKIKRKITL